MSNIDKFLVFLYTISFFMLIGSLFYGFILACMSKFYSQIFLMISFSGVLSLIFHYLIAN